MKCTHNRPVSSNNFSRASFQCKVHKRTTLHCDCSGDPKMSIKKKTNRNYISRKKLFQFLFKSYIKSAYSGIAQMPKNGSELRREYYNDMNDCSSNEKPRNTSHQHLYIPKAISTINKNTKTIIEGGGGAVEAMRRNMTVTNPSDRKFESNDDIAWGKKINVSLVRTPTASFGVCIVGGKVNINNTQISGIFIKNIIPSSPADLSKQIKIGDRILSVNGKDVSRASQDEAINLIKNAGCSIELVLQNFDTNESEEKKANNNNETTKEQSKEINEISSVPKTQSNNVTTKTAATDSEYSSSDDEDEEETAGKILTKAGVEIDRKSAGNMKRTKEEANMDDEQENEFGYTNLKIKKKYGAFGTIIRIRIQRDTNNSMGLALAGHRNRTEMGSFIAGINPKGNANNQDIKVGDEILEINGRVLHKLCHLNTSVIIKGIPGVNLEFILLRKDSAEDHLAVKPVTNFPAVFDQFDQLYSCFKNVRSVTIQKIGTSLGIMIIEGKHSEVGQGIFISDIQENSNAEIAGVKIGEMILAVNKDLLIDCNYDTAASLLKRAEGIVSLTLCNPNKKDDLEVKPTEDSTMAGKVVPKDKAPSAKDTKKVEAPPAEPEPPKDPATAEIGVNKETIIEINAENKTLGLLVVKGDNSLVQAGVCVILIHANGAVHKDNRLKLFDKILEIDGVKMSSETSDDELRKKFKTTYSKVKMTVYRADPFDLKDIEIDVTKKSGKDLGLGFAECKGTGLYITEIVPGSIIDLDKRLIKGDIITHINGDDIRNSDLCECSLLLKAAQPKLIMKIVRPKGKK